MYVLIVKLNVFIIGHAWHKFLIRRNIDEIEEILVVHQIFYTKVLLATADVALATVSTISNFLNSMQFVNI